MYVTFDLRHQRTGKLTDRLAYKVFEVLPSMTIAAGVKAALAYLGINRTYVDALVYHGDASIPPLAQFESIPHRAELRIVLVESTPPLLNLKEPV